MISFFIVCLWLCGFQVLGFPIHIRSAITSPSSENVQCASVNTYTVQWFLNEAFKRREIDLPLHNALFYTRGMSKMAKEYACDHDLITIWSIWDRSLYDFRNESTNAMRCIHNNAIERQQFFESMSEAFARLAIGTAIVMHNNSDWTHPPEDGIWYQVEYRTMREVTETVTTILKLKEKDSNSALVIWDRKILPQLDSEKQISEVIAAGRHVPHFLGNALDWTAGSLESAKQAVLEQKKDTDERAACSNPITYPYEIY